MSPTSLSEMERQKVVMGRVGGGGGGAEDNIKRQDVVGVGKGLAHNCTNTQHKCHGNQFTAKLNKVPASINFHMLLFVYG